MLLLKRSEFCCEDFKFPQNAIVNVEKMAWLRENSAIKK